MMLKREIVIALMGMVSLVSADIKVDSEIVTQTGSDGIEFSGQVLVQRIWTEPSPTHQANLGGILGAGKVLFHSLLTTSGLAETWSDQPQGMLEYEDADSGDAALDEGRFLIHMLDHAGTGLVDFYLQQSQQGSPQTEHESERISAIYDTSGAVGGFDLDTGGSQVIPEPAVAVLLGVFGGSMLIGRRLFSKKS